MPYIRIGCLSDLPPEGAAKEFTIGDRVVCVANVNGTISAVDNVCLHRGGPLGQGVIMDSKIVCPWHGWMWDPKTGEATHDPTTRLAVYPIKVDGDDVLVDL
jgi:nitrite reductase (NADH) small subunit